MSLPRLSVGLPVFNGEAFLASAIESVLAQDFTDLELIISDNGSTDATAAIASHYAALDPRVRFYREEVNRGGAWNFNRVFQLSTAPLFKWQAHDDLCLPGFFGVCVTALERAPESVVAVYPHIHVTDAHGCPLPGYRPEEMEALGPRPHQRLANALRRMTMVSAQFGIIRSAALRQTRLYDRMIAADWILLAELAMLGEIRQVPQVLFQRRIHEGISTKANRGSVQLLRWWDPGAHRPRNPLPPMIRLGWEYVRSVGRLPLAPLDKLQCAAAAVWTWYGRRFRNVMGRLLRNLGRHVTTATVGS